jgi:hypothetical protein
MQTAWVVNSSDAVNFTLPGLSQGSESLLLLYFAEIEMLNISTSRSFYVSINGESMDQIVTPIKYSTEEWQFIANHSFFNFGLSKAPNSTLLPIINAYEYYSPIDIQPATSSQDIEALDAIKRSFDIKDWISDPCYLIMWNGIRCDNRSPGIRNFRNRFVGKESYGIGP